MTDHNFEHTTASADQENLQAQDFGRLCESRRPDDSVLKVRFAENSFCRLLGVTGTQPFGEWVWDRYYDDDLGNTEVELGLMIVRRSSNSMNTVLDAVRVPLGTSELSASSGAPARSGSGLVLGWYSLDKSQDPDGISCDELLGNINKLLVKCGVSREMTDEIVAGSAIEPSCGYSPKTLDLMFDADRRSSLAYSNTEDCLEGCLEDLLLSNVPSDIGWYCPVFECCSEEMTVYPAANPFVRMLGVNGEMDCRQFIDRVLRSEDADFKHENYGMVVAYKLEGTNPYWKVEGVDCGQEPREGALTIGWYRYADAPEFGVIDGCLRFMEWCDLLAAWLTRCVGNNDVIKAISGLSVADSQETDWQTATRRFRNRR